MASLVPNLYKVCLIGNSGVGKTSIFNSIRGKEFSKEPKAETNTCSLSYVVNGEDGQDINVTVSYLLHNMRNTGDQTAHHRNILNVNSRQT